MLKKLFYGLKLLNMLKDNHLEKIAYRTAIEDILNDSEVNILSELPDNQEISLIDDFGDAF